jgi:hypothetical protein
MVANYVPEFLAHSWCKYRSNAQIGSTLRGMSKAYAPKTGSYYNP